MKNQRLNLKKAITIGTKKFNGFVKYRSRFFLIFRAAQVLINVFEKFYPKKLDKVTLGGGIMGGKVSCHLVFSKKGGLPGKNFCRCRFIFS